jgi:DmsE family decaheme c-type cytochrome
MAVRGISLRAVLVTAGIVVATVGLVAASCTRVQRPPQLPQSITTASADAYVGAEACQACHTDQFATFRHTKMGLLFLNQPRNDLEKRACENCHGPGKAHVEAGGGKGVGGLITFGKQDRTPVEERNAVCLQCHERTNRLFWQGSAHESRDVACTGCHKVMENVSPKSLLAKVDQLETCGQCHAPQRAGQLKNSRHPLAEGKMTCTSCHNPHGSVTPALLKENSPNDTCYTCHAEKRGPFLWEHMPVTESCGNCHDPHGTNHEAMLKVTQPRLCQQCHVETRHPTRPYGLDTPSKKFVLGQSCSSCHVNIHGSNHPSGFAFTR